MHLFTKHIANATSVQIHKSDWLTVSDPKSMKPR